MLSGNAENYADPCEEMRLNTETSNALTKSDEADKVVGVGIEESRSWSGYHTVKNALPCCVYVYTGCQLTF